MEDLLVRMELDSAPVAKRITSLLLDSFQPLDKGRQEQVRTYKCSRGVVCAATFTGCAGHLYPLPSCRVAGTLHCSHPLQPFGCEDILPTSPEAPHTCCYR